MNDQECPATRTCSKCKKMQPTTEFSPKKRANGLVNLQSWCKTCYRENRMAKYRQDSTKSREISNRWKREHREQNLAKMGEWRDAHREHLREYYRDRYYSDPARAQAQARAWRVRNPEKHLATVTAWQKANPIRAKAIKRNAHARRKRSLKLACPAWADQKAINDIYEEAVLLSFETGIEHHVDHIIPIRGKNVRGLHWEGNLQVLPKDLNLAKSNKVEDIV